MGYSIPGTEIRLIDVSSTKPQVRRAWTPAMWHCDPCAPSKRRFTVQHPGGLIEHAWFAVLTVEDNARVRFVKYQAAKKHIAAREAFLKARGEWLAANG